MECPSGKVTYGKRASAKKAARTIKTNGGHTKDGRNMKPYKCSECGWWHLTTSVKRRTEADYKE